MNTRLTPTCLCDEAAGAWPFAVEPAAVAVDLAAGGLASVGGVDGEFGALSPFPESRACASRMASAQPGE